MTTGKVKTIVCVCVSDEYVVVPDNEDEFVQVKKEEEEEDDVMSEGEMSWETAAEGDEADGYNDSNKSTEDEVCCYYHIITL